MRIIHSTCILIGLILGAAMSPSSPAQSVPTTDSQLLNIFLAQEAAWNRGDGAAFATAFSDDADFVNIRSDIFHGRDMIGKRHAMIFSGPFKGSHTTITIRHLTEVTPGVALIETDHEVTGFKFLPPGAVPTAEGVLKTRMKYIAVKQGEEWHLIAAQNTAILLAAPPLH
jgi:uncharacterized protein (TIGR02246 family)